MYFKEKGDTNIDSEFEKNKKFSLNFNFKNIKPKTMLFIGGGIILLLLAIFLIISLTGNSNKYTIELVGSERITINLGDEYVEPGYSAYDEYNNDSTSQVKVTNNVNVNQEGQYEVRYSIGNTDKVRYVTVTKVLEKTFIHLTGGNYIYLKVGEKYVEPGYTVYDGVDQNLTEKVKVTGKVNTSKVGTYQITYSVVNSRNITTTVKRTVAVVAK